MARTRLTIALLMAVIFFSGVWVGITFSHRFTKEAATNESTVDTNRMLRAMNRKAMARYSAKLKLTDEQQRRLTPVFRSAGRKMLALPKRSMERLAVLEKFHLELDTYLTEEQKLESAEILEDSRATLRK